MLNTHDYIGTKHDSFVQLDILENGTRNDVINWLCWNDRNGCYRDDDAIAEGYDPLTLEQAREIMRGQIDG